MLLLNSIIVFILRNQFKKMCENINFDITKFELIHNFEIVFKKNFNLTNLTTSENFICYKNFQNFMIVKYFHRNINKFQFKTSMF